MANFTKWLGVSIGWSFGGPIGAIIGYALGSLLESAVDAKRLPQGKSSRRSAAQPRSRNTQQQRRAETRPGDFEISLLVLSAIVIKADGKIDQRELKYVRNYFKSMYGEQRAANAFKLFNEIIKNENISTRQVCLQIKQQMAHASRLQLMHYMFGIAKADGNVTQEEVHTIDKISGYLGISRADFESLKAMFFDSVDNAYKILEITKNASNEEVKKAYRRMVKKHHPDKLQHLGKEHLKGAEEKFRQIQQAYEQIKKERNL